MSDLSVAGRRINPETGELINPDSKNGLLKSEEENEEYEGLSPLAMGLLQAGASMMRNSGWRNRPMTTSEMIGHAIPAGLGGYLNQDARNQQGEAEFYAQQQAEQQAEQALRQQQSQANAIQSFADMVSNDPDLSDQQKKSILARLNLGADGYVKAMERYDTIKDRTSFAPMYERDGMLFQRDRLTGEETNKGNVPSGYEGWETEEILAEDGKLKKYKVSPNGKTKILLGESGGQAELELKYLHLKLDQQKHLDTFGLEKDEYAEKIRQYDLSFDFKKKLNAEDMEFKREQLKQKIIQDGIKNGVEIEKLLQQGEHFYAQLGHTMSKDEKSQMLAEARLARDIKNDADTLALRVDSGELDKEKLELEKKKLAETILNRIGTQGLTADKIELQREKIEADIEHQLWEREQKDKGIPQTLFGEEAREWAKARNISLRETDDEVIIKLDKNGEFISEEYLPRGELSEDQQRYIVSEGNDWDDSQLVVQSNKLASLLRGLENLSSDDSGTKEFAMIYQFMKSLDPNSTVLASEFANARNSGLSWVQALKQNADKGATGSALTDKQKKGIVDAVKEIAKGFHESIKGARETEIKRAKTVFANLDEDTLDPFFSTGLDDYYQFDRTVEGIEDEFENVDYDEVTRKRMDAGYQLFNQ